MKALTLWQPWASLVGLGVKTIETRSWSTSYRGPLAIHAGLRRPPMMYLPPLPRGREADPHEGQRWLVVNTITDPAYQGPRPTGKRVPLRALTPTMFFPSLGPHGRPRDPAAGTSATQQGTAVYLPLGAVVATCTLADVVPIVELGVRTGKEGAATGEVVTTVAGDLLLVRYSPPWGDRTWTDIEDQRPYGDFTPGRFAWLLADIDPVDPPVPAKGRQGLWEWEGAA